MRISVFSAPPARRSATALLALALTGATLAGCGNSSNADEPTGAASAPGVSVRPTPTPSSSAPAPTPTPRPTRKPTEAQHGNGDGEGDEEPAAAGGGICRNLSEAEVGAALGGTVRGVGLSGGGCAFTQRAARAPAVNFVQSKFADMVGGMAGAKVNATSSVEGEPQDVAGVGDEAFVVTGTSFGGEDVQGAGAVRVGDALMSVELAQSAGLTAKQVKALVVKVLELAVAQLG